jgi:hypothetical protein
MIGQVCQDGRYKTPRARVWGIIAPVLSNLSTGQEFRRWDRRRLTDCPDHVPPFRSVAVERLEAARGISVARSVAVDRVGAARSILVANGVAVDRIGAAGGIV